jgi:hypothetical protein
MPITLVGAPQYQWMAKFLPGVSSPGRCSSFGSGPSCARMRSGRTGNEPLQGIEPLS